MKKIGLEEEIEKREEREELTVEQEEGEEAATGAAVSTPACVLCQLDQSRSNNEDFPGWDFTEDKSSCLRQDVSL